jgi:hypothetical protein
MCPTLRNRPVQGLAIGQQMPLTIEFRKRRRPHPVG